MIGLDTNVLVRLLVEDDPDQCARARRFIKRAVADEESLFVCEIVLCELVWVLSAGYRFPRAEIAGILRELLRVREATIEAEDAVRRAMDRYATGGGDLADHLLLEHAVAAGCSRVATFDRKLAGRPPFVEP